MINHLSFSDLIDGLNIRKGLDPLEALRKALEQFDPQVPVFHVVGEFTSFFQKQLSKGVQGRERYLSATFSRKFLSVD